jgi:hypothetical protein
MSAPTNISREKMREWRGRIVRRQPWENIATGVIAGGVLMLLQPLSMTLYSYSFVTMLAGVVAFTIVSKFPE